MTSKWKLLQLAIISSLILSCSPKEKKEESMEKVSSKTAKEILGNPEYLAISYGGYRQKSREMQPTVAQLKDDMKILYAMGVRILRTYNVQPDKPHASNVLKAISELKKEDPGFEMYVMLGAWIDCKNAWTELPPDHDVESEQNEAEIGRAAALANQYPDIVKVIAVGNEAMVKWAASYFVQPGVILKWVNHLQQLKTDGKLPKDLWITSSDDFSSWGGGGPEYHVDDLNKLIGAVDYISMHTYPMHNTHYNPDFWGIFDDEDTLPKADQMQKAMERSLDFAKAQHARVTEYMQGLGYDKPVHIGETGWASIDSDNHHYGRKGSGACDEYKEALYYKMMREWTNKEGISCFYFEAFDEPWKDAHNSKGSENHFGLFKGDGRAKYAVWDLVDQGVFEGLTRDGNPIVKTFDGDAAKVLEEALMPPLKKTMVVTE